MVGNMDFFRLLISVYFSEYEVLTSFSNFQINNKPPGDLQRKKKMRI